MWCPSVSLSVWANSWLAGAAAPDDVLDALSQWAPTHSVTAYDSVAAERTGLAWPDLDDVGSVSLLQTMRTASSPRTTSSVISVVLPVPGDVRGLPPGTQFGRDAVTAGEAILVAPPDGAVGLVPDFEYSEDADAAGDDEFEAELSALAWTVYSFDAVPHTPHFDLGEAEYLLRDAVRSAADAMGALRAGTSGSELGDPRALVEQVLETMLAHRIPDHAPTRAVRVLENAAHVDAIITVSSGLIPIGLQSSSEVQLAGDALRPLISVVRSARLAAVDAILQSAWRG
ncbi:hypothetical protein CRI77_02885 [Mycolicibacterium duvalii]|uniref:Uncharacterized protein n=1 Tax=Mycolicibacterium duvalii TaxID=39688 RepID=A0A7I7JZN9_9MYCO|nr:hypothetical protein [Mycolicibacterium duvalii]MCV7366799.1 hypothetical protein [Mycolicibacterium duvalii]PEG43927.1 hypothetical protein CRI77_02885 [Mycolicibacterium duvalii]BBX16739.1 hypothetical protein MDUV_15990 [Mycolicibacterium duvalii]